MLLRWLQSRLVYHPVRGCDRTPAEAQLTFEEVRFTAADGCGLHGWIVPCEPDDPWLLYCHGNAGNLAGRVEFLGMLRSIGANVLAFDYRGYGLSEGKPSEEGTFADATAAWEVLTGRGVAPERICLLGKSLGGAVASELAMRVPCGGLVLDSAFTSIADMGKHLYPWLPVRWIVRFRYATLEHVRRVRCPLLVLHGRDDTLVPIAHARRILDAANEPKRLVELDGGHADCQDVSWKTYAEAVGEMLRGCGR